MKIFNIILALLLCFSNEGVAQIFSKQNNETKTQNLKLKGGEAYSKGDYVQALNLWKQAAEFGDAGAQFNVGVIYLQGNGVPVDLKSAFYWVKKSAEQGYADAQYVLGSFYDLGKGTTEDQNEANKWYLAAANEGIVKAQAQMGFRYEEGYGIEKNLTEAIKWYTKAANQGNTFSQMKLFNVYKNGEGVKKNITEAIKWLTEAANGGDENALNQLAFINSINTKNTIGNKDNEIIESVQSEKSDIDTRIPKSKENLNSTTYVVIIGNEDYDNVSNVAYAKHDCEILSEYMTKTLGLPQNHVKIFKNASYGNLLASLKYIENLSEAYGRDLNLIFYYAGHGVPNEKTQQAMLLPIDGDASIPETCYDLGKLYSQLGNLNANLVLVLMDACFSGSLRGDGMLTAARGVKIKSDMSKPNGNMIILTAAQGDETAFPYIKEEHGMFTFFLLKKLQETEGNVTLGELSDYIVEKVKQQSVVINGKLQSPSIFVSSQMEDKWKDIKFGN